MKKIVALIDAAHFREEQLDVFQYISRVLKGKLVIVFLENEAGPILYAPDFREGISPATYTEVLETDKEIKDKIKRNITSLKEACIEKDIWFHFHEDKGLPAEEAILESRFADIVIMNRDISFALLYDSDPTLFVKNVLAGAQCPVLIVPDNMKEIKEVFFAYNGSFSSMFAIKQFTQLFAVFTERKATVVYIAENNTPAMPHEKLLKEYLNMYYDSIEFITLAGEPDTAIKELLNNRKDCIITFGAYGRSNLSRFFKRSKADNILRELDTPIFITHP